MKTSSKKYEGRIRRHARVRAQVEGTQARPRLSVYKSNRYLHAQIIDDAAGRTLVSGSTKEADGANKKKSAAAVWLGGEIAKRAQKAHIGTVVFDRGGFRYIGRVAAFAEAVREGGITM